MSETENGEDGVYPPFPQQNPFRREASGRSAPWAYDKEASPKNGFIY